MLAIFFLLATQASAIEETEVPASWASDYQQARSSWTPLRIQVVYNATSVPNTDLLELQSRVVPDVVRWYGKTLRVPRTSSTLKVTQPYCGQASVPTQHQTVGIDADVVIYIVTVPYYYREWDPFTYGAPCLVSATVPKRVLAGTIWLQMDWFSPLPLNEKFALVARHFGQVLAFHAQLFANFNRPDGSLYSLRDYLKMDNFASGVSNYYLTFPSVVKLAREAFNCPTLPGVRINDISYSMTFWSARMMLNDFMSDYRTMDQPAYSDVTFAVFQDSGWYEVQWKYTTPIQFGKGRGCSLFQTLCIGSGQPVFPEFCVSGNSVCGPLLTTYGWCSITTYTYGISSPYNYLGSTGGRAEVDYCPVVEYGQSCLDGTASGGDEKCPECRCVAGDYRPTGSPSPGVVSHCQRISCRDSKAFVHVGSEEVECPAAGGQVVIAGYDGTLTCPPVARVCSPAPCKNFCSGFGVCSNGTCLCESGHAGSDCSITCHYTCERCSGTAQNECTGCRPGATLASGQCACNAGLTMNSEGACSGQVTCHSSCKTCSGPTATDCTSCRASATLSSGACQCAEGSVLNLSGECVTCGSNCLSCQFPQTSVCLGCYGDSVLSAAGTCTCPDGKIFDSLLRKCTPCDSRCVTCSGTPAYCLSCSAGVTASGGVCGCASGQYLSGASCASCHSTCLSCSGPLEDSCTSCRADSYLQSLPGRCLCRTPTATNCMQCDPVCQTCQPPNTFKCTSCFSNASVDPFTLTCKCKAGFYPNSDARNCVTCHTTCETCYASGPAACKSCPITALYVGGSCVCKPRYYLDAGTQTCQQCPEHCNSCKASYCESCDGGFEFDANHVCTLLDGYYYDASSNAVYTCPYLCKTCVLASKGTACTVCMYQLTLGTDNVCRCQVGFYFDEKLKTCERCVDPNCLECASAAKCSKCVAPLQSQDRTNDDPAMQCWCTSGYFLSAGACEPCHPNCKTCISASRNACRSCFQFSTLTNNGYCKCNQGAKETNCETCDGGVIVCESLTCHSTCLTCSGPGFADCTSCRPSGVLDAGTCPCSPNILVGDQCRRCPATCLECNSSGGCSACYALANILPSNDGVCVCVGSYPNPTTAHCSPCHKSCAACSGPLATHCTACKLYATRLSDGTCVCRGLYSMKDDGSCFVGSYLCSNARCSECKNSAFLLQKWQDTDQQFFGDCGCNTYYITSWQKGNFTEYNTGICHKCNKMCRSGCSIFKDLCNSCEYHAVGTLLSSLSFQYMTCSCDRGYYAGEEGCQKCPVGCLNCNAQGKCDQCLSGYELKVESLTCVCLTASCKCPSGTFLLKQTGLCELLCPSGFNGVEGECKDTGVTKFTFSMDRVASSFLDSTGTFTLTAGSSGTLYSPLSVLYQRGAYFSEPGSSFLQVTSNAAQGSKQLVIAPTHYIEMWIRADFFSLRRDNDDYLLSGETGRLNYDVWSESMTFSDAFGRTTYVYPPSSTSVIYLTGEWLLRRYEIITEPRAAGFITKIRVTKNNQLVREQTVLEYYYRDAPFGLQPTSLLLTTHQYSTFKSYLAELTIANRKWTAETSVPCGCPLCTTSGSCLSTCMPTEFPTQSGSCGQCLPTCDQGCVRATDCLLNVDPLCSSWTSFTNCTGCKPLASFVQGVCTCGLHSTFRPENNTCTCDANFQLSNNECVMCLNYFSPDDVTVTIDDYFMSMVISFAEEVQAPSSDNCASYFMPETFRKLGSEPKCTWRENSKELKIIFGSEATVMVEEVLLDNTKLLKKKGSCSFKAPKLRPVAKFNGKMPAPEPVLSAPSSVALDCSATGSLQLSSLGTKGGKGREMQFKWTFAHSSMGVLFPQYSNYSSQSLVALPLNAFAAGSLTVLLTAVNKFGKEGSVRQVIEMKGGRALVVDFESGSALNITSQDQGQVKAFVRDTCGVAGDRRFSWTFIGPNATLPDTAKDPSLLLRISRVPYALYIGKGALTPGYSYTFEVVAEQAGITGSAQVTITVLRSPLILRLNRMSGTHPSDMTLRLDASLSSDPDKLSGMTTYLWTCTDGAGACLDVNGSALLGDRQLDSHAFAPQVLRPSAKYNFTVTISKDQRTATGWTLVEIVAPTGCSIALPLVNMTINSHSEFALIPNVDTSLETDFLWKQVVGPAVNPASKPQFAFLAFRANTLQGGQIYSFELTAKTVVGTSIALFGFQVNLAPIGGKVATQPTTGRALIDDFLLYTESWEDPEGNYPLNYQFCISKSGNEPYCLSGGQAKPWQNSKLYKGSLTLIARVFDYLGGRSECSTTISISPAGRLLDTFDPVTSFRSDVEDPENTYAMAIAYSESLTASDPFFKLMMWTVGNYTATVFAVTSQVLDSYLGAVLAMSRQAVSHSSDNALHLLQDLNATISRYDSSLTSVELSRAAAVVSSIVANASDQVRVQSTQLLVQLAQQYNAQQMPSETAFKASSAGAAVIAQRATAASLAQLNLTVGNLTVAAAPGWLAGIPATDILDLYVSAYNSSDSLSWTVQLQLQRSGSYSNYNVRLTSRVSISTVSNPLNVSIPCAFPNDTEIECIGETQTGEWSNDVCKVLQRRSGSVLVSTTLLSAITVRKVPEGSVPEGSIPVPSGSTDCEVNPAPLSIAAGVLLLCVVGVVLTCCLRLDKKPTTEQKNGQEVSSLELSGSAIRTEKVGVDGEKRLFKVRRNEPQEQATQKVQPDQITPEIKDSSLLTFHLLFRGLAKREELISCICIVASTALVQMAVLGLCYEFWHNDSSVAHDAMDVFSQYSEKDLRYVGVALGIGTLVSSGQQLCKWKRAVCVVAAIVSACALGGVTYMNSDMCYSSGGRWGEGAMWTLLLQFLILETVKAFALLSRDRLRSK